MLDYIMPEEAMDAIAAEFATDMGSEKVALTGAVGRVLAEDVLASEYVPGFNRSAMDGYAVIAAETIGLSEDNPKVFRIQEVMQMGQACSGPIEPGCCVYVPTGANIPDGADAVVMIEYAEPLSEDTVALKKEVTPGLHYVSKGDDVYPGKKVLPKGRRIKTSDIGALAAMGIIEVPVVRKPMVGIISTGDELIPRDQVPTGGQIRDVNSATIEVLLKEVGADSKFYGICIDEKTALGAVVEKAVSECDMVLISGGSSVGLKDATAEIIADRGELIIKGIQAKPGKPTIIGRINGKPVFGLPGHPVSSFFNTEVFVKHTIRGMMGCNADAYTVKATLTDDIKPYKGRTAFVGVKLLNSDASVISATDSALQAVPLPAMSATISVLAGADGWVVIPKGSDSLKAGEVVNIHLLGQ